MRNTAMKALQRALGQSAPEWILNWEPGDVEALMMAHRDRGTLRKMKFESVRVGEFDLDSSHAHSR